MERVGVKNVAIINLDYYDAKDNYSDGEIENDIFDLVKSGGWKEKIYQKNMGYPVLYHLSHIRENILNWYPFCSQDSILEIGSGCGAITGIFCKKAKKVVSVELSKRRAQINYERHKDYKNLEIIVGNLNDIIFNEKFDYIILNGVLEYAISFTKGDTPYETFLNHLKAYLEPTGKIMIAIENRLGLKYFSGASEDHTRNYFLGLNGYIGNHQVRTFSKNELKLLLENCGFCDQKFYYPYPDYKFPYEIFTDDSIEKYKYGRQSRNFDENRYFLFDEELVMASLRNEGVLSVFANSFLVIAGKHYKKTEPEIEYVKLSNDRKEKYQLATVIQSIEIGKNVRKKEVIKFALNESAQNHIGTIHQNEQWQREDRKEEKCWKILKGKMLEQAIRYDYIEEDSLDQLIESYILLQVPNCIEEELENFFTIYFQSSIKKENYHTETFCEIFGKERWKEEAECILPANIDLIFNNIFVDKDTYIIIDCEWIFAFAVPCKFIIWRSINELYTIKGKRLESLLKRRDLMKRFQISEEDEILFRKWANHFTDSYLGCNQMKQYQQPGKEFSLNRIYEKEKRHRFLCSSLYYDLGNGFCEENKIYKEVPILENHFSVEFQIDAIGDFKELRWDPVEGECCECVIEELQGFHKLIPVNAAYTEGEKSIFYTEDPIYTVITEEVTSEKILIKGIIKFLEKDTIIANLRKENQIYQDEKILMEEMVCKVEKMQKEIENVAEEKDARINSLERKLGVLERKIQRRERRKR